VPGGSGRVGDALDSSAISPIAYNGSVGVITTVNPVTHRVRVGIDTAGLPTGGTWSFQDLDGPGVAGAGRTGDNIGLDVATVRTQGKQQSGVHVFYTHNGVLRDAYSVDAISWTFTDLDGPGVAGGNGRTASTVSGPTSAVVEGAGLDGAVHVFYIRNVGPLNQYVLRHAWFDGSTWRFEDLDAQYIGRYGSAVWKDGVLHYFSWHEGGWLRHAWNDGTWHFEDLDGPGVPGGNGRTGEFTGAINHAVVWNGQLHVFSTRHAAPAPFNQVVVLRHAWFDGTTWRFEDVDGPGVPGGGGRTSDFVATSFGSQAAGVIPTTNELHILYDRQSSPPGLRDAWLDASGWHFGDVDGVAATGSPGHVTADVGTSAAVAFYAGQLHAFFFDRTNHRLRWACATGGNAAAPAACV
jgi:hypothetical protein